MLDATRGMESQDMNILNLIKKNNKGLVLVVNKWDLVEKTTNTTRDYTKNIKEIIAPFQDVPILFTSAIHKQRIMRVLETAMEVYNNRKRRINTGELNRMMLKYIEAYPPPSVKGKYIKIKYITQLPTPYPSFAFFCNLPQYVREAYKRYLENKLRENFKFTGTPMHIYMRKK
jgi:GTP-binding protein